MKAKYGEWNFYRYRVLVRIEGFRIERLLSKAFDYGIKIKSLKIVSDTEAVGWIAKSDLKYMRKLGKSLYRITVIGSQGPEQKIRSAVKKPIAIIGTILAAAIVMVQSLFVCTIRIDGYKAIPEDSLRLCLERSGIYEGVFRPDIDWDKARDDLRATFPQLTWIQLVYDGRVVYLNVAESSGKILSEEAEQDSDIFIPSQKPEEKYCDIVAERSGYIESISTLWGLALVEPGDYVEEGQVLISGVVPTAATTFQEGWPTEYYVKSQGEIMALIPYHETFNQERYIKSEGVEEFTRDDGEDSSANGSAQSGLNVVENYAEKTEEQAEAVVNQQIRIWAKENLPEKAEIVNKSLNFSYKKNIIEVSVTLEVRQQIGIEKEIVVGQENSDN